MTYSYYNSLFIQNLRIPSSELIMTQGIEVNTVFASHDSQENKTEATNEMNRANNYINNVMQELQNGI